MFVNNRLFHTAGATAPDEPFHFNRYKEGVHAKEHA
jgi:hypothetical protein